MRRHVIPTRTPLRMRLLRALASPMGLALVGVASAAIVTAWGRM
ncbi:MAG TPA: hypothetical protein VIN58_01090 [Roseateles sp.]